MNAIQFILLFWYGLGFLALISTELVDKKLAFIAIFLESTIKIILDVLFVYFFIWVLETSGIILENYLIVGVIIVILHYIFSSLKMYLKKK